MTSAVLKVVKEVEINLQNAFKEDKIRSLFESINLIPKQVHFYKLYDSVGSVIIDIDTWEKIRNVVGKFPPVEITYYKSGSISSFHTRAWMDNQFEKNPNMNGTELPICPLLITWNNFDGYQASWTATTDVGLMNVKCAVPKSLVANILTREYFQDRRTTRVSFNQKLRSEYFDAGFVCWSNLHSDKTPNQLTIYFTYLTEEPDALTISLDMIDVLAELKCE